MYEQMGETTNAAKYGQLAKSVAAPAAGQAARQSTAAAAARPVQNASNQSFGPRPRPMVSRR
jgi:hypothetical protein